MLSDEEKKVIDLLKNIDKQKCMMLKCPVVKNNIERQLKIIELNRTIRKKSKEIEELQVNNKKLQDKCKELIFEKQELTSALLDSTPKDKIKAKIEPKLKELDKNMKKEWQEYGNSREYQDMEDEWNFLQSLLGKE